MKRIIFGLIFKLVFTLLFVCPVLSQERPNFSQKQQEGAILRTAFLGLGEGVPVEDVHKNLTILRAGGIDTIFMLLNELDNQNLASKIFDSTSRMKRDPASGQIIGFEQQRLGEVAFYLIQNLVEGQIPLNYQSYGVLKPAGIKQWLDERKSKSLQELQIEAVEKAIDNVKASLKEGESVNRSEALAFFEMRRNSLLKKSK